ncbi:MAG: hypothetical protein C5B49_00660 [Bdellovibrio sp.]|nr:MAG: hypothetical protein C5B49_00660 [Bdellovibrio sp.]
MTAPLVERAQHSDSIELRQFFEQFTIKGLVELRQTRPLDFFSPYRIASDEFETFVLRGKNREVQGLVSFVYREVFLDGKIEKLALATDLRILGQRGPLLSWSQNFLPVIRDIYERKKVLAVFSTVNRGDPTVSSVFLRPRSPRRAWPRYHLYRRYDLVTLHGRFPWHRKSLSSLRLVRAHTGLKDLLIQFLVDRSQYYPMASAWDATSFERRLARMPGLLVENFWMALDHKGKVVGCMGSWSPGSLQEFRPLSYSLVAHNFRQFLKFGRLLGWTRPLTKPVRSTGVEAPLHFRYLVYPYAANEDVFESLLNQVYEHSAPNEFLVYSHAEQGFRRRPPRCWVSSRQPYSLYALIPPERPVPQFLDPSEILNPELEAYLF